MTAETKFREMAMAADAAIRDFNDFADDQAVWWAWEKIGSLRDTLQAIATIATPACDNHIRIREVQRLASAAISDCLKSNASVSIPGGEPGYDPRECSASSCCGAGVTVAGGSEGTNWYECVSCGNPCDLVPVHRDQNGGVDRPTMAGKEAGQ
jgi:hypothetical protein